MKLNGKSILITTILMLVFAAVFFICVAMFFSGPSRAFEKNVDDKISKITSEYKNVENLERKTFYYVTYIGENNDMYLFFNDLGELIDSREKKTKDIEKVKALVLEKYQIETDDISLGYGYNNPTYVIKYASGTITLDYDNLKEIYHEKR